MIDNANKSDGSSGDQHPVAAFVISLIAGLWMLSAGGMMAVGWSMGADIMGGASPWMWRHNMMGWIGPGVLWPIVGFIIGILIVASSVAMLNSPKSTTAWGFVILVASGVDMFAGSGGYLASALGIGGGVMAIAWKH